MDTNLDIDRISLEDRIKALEANKPGGGGSGGVASNFFIDPNVVDTCPENAATVVDGGLIVRLDIDDIGQVPVAGGQRKFQDFGIKIASFYPKINGIYHSCSSFLMRVHVLRESLLTSGSSPTTNYRPTFNSDAWKSELFDSLQIQSYSAQKIADVWADCSLSPFYSSSGDLSGSVLTSWRGQFGLDSTGVVLYMSASHTTSSSSTLFPCYCFGTGKYPPHPFPDQYPPTYSPQWFIGSESNAGRYGSYAVARPQDLPQAIKSVYPPSWYA